MEYLADIFEVQPGEHGLDGVNAALKAMAAAGWTLHSQSMTAVSTGINHKVLTMVVFERSASNS